MPWEPDNEGAFGEPALEGMWVNPHQDTRGLTKLEITKNGDKWQMQAWGRCHPEDCEWGKVDLHLLAASAGSKDQTHAFAKWEPGFKTQYVVIQIEKEQLLVQTISVFKGPIRAIRL